MQQSGFKVFETKLSWTRDTARSCCHVRSLCCHHLQCRKSAACLSCAATLSLFGWKVPSPGVLLRPAVHTGPVTPSHRLAMLLSWSRQRRAQTANNTAQHRTAHQFQDEHSMWRLNVATTKCVDARHQKACGSAEHSGPLKQNICTAQHSTSDQYQFRTSTVCSSWTYHDQSVLMQGADKFVEVVNNQCPSDKTMGC